MSWAVGKHFISAMLFNGVTYNLWVMFANDVAEFWSINVSKGAWDVSNPDILATASIDESMKGKTPEECLATAIAKLNTQLKAAMGGAIPVTWEEKLESLLSKLVLFLEGTVLQVR